MSFANLTAPVVALIGLVPEARISGPDERGHVWLTGRSAEGAPASIDLGHIGTPAAEAGLRWRARTSEAGSSPARMQGAGPAAPH